MNVQSTITHGIVVFILLLLGATLPAQTGSTLATILSKTDTAALSAKADLWKQQSEKAYREAVALAQEKGWPIRREDSTGVMEIAFINDNGSPVYRVTHNADAAISTQTDLLHSGGGAGYNLNGNGMTVGEWDGGGVLTNHEQLVGRVTQIDNPSGNNNHATHVAGTLIGSGNGNSNAKGMAPEAELHAYDWNSDNSEMALAAADGLLISNHSYGFITGWYAGGSDWYGNLNISTEEDYNFGRYSVNGWDDIARDAPYYLIVKSAGNDRNDNPPPSGSSYYYNVGDTNLTYDPVNHPNTSPAKDGGADGYDCISYYGLSKNILTIGAVHDVLSYSGPGDVNMSSFSGWGPADDGRIKPDIVGNGVGLTSSVASGTNHYSSYSGTSMSGPNVAGSMLLLQEHYINTHAGDPMLAATLKALVIHSARATGSDEKPDYKFGWGLLSTADAAEVITNSEVNDSIIMELTLNNGDTYTREYTAAGGEPFKVTIAWTDLPGSTQNGLNDRTPVLVNDLDLRVTGGGTTYEPFLLDPDNPGNTATNGDNDVDNVEQVYIDNPTAGETMTLTVNHKGSLASPQDFSMIVSGADLTLLPVDFISFAAKAEEGRNLLEWEAISKGTDRMEVQRWWGNAFQTIGSVSAQNEKGPHRYTFADRDIGKQSEFLYRIRSVDFDGHVKYSPLANIHRVDSEQLAIFPNPAREYWEVRSDKDVEHVRLRNLQGQLIRAYNQLPERIDASSLRPGTYILEVDHREGRTVELLQVQD